MKMRASRRLQRRRFTPRPLGLLLFSLCLWSVFQEVAPFRTFPDLSAEWQRRFQEDDSRDIRTPLFMELSARSGASMSADVQSAIKFARTLELKGTIGLERLHWPARVRSSASALAGSLRVSGEARDAIASLDLFLPNASSAFPRQPSGPDPLAGLHYGRLRALFVGSWADALGDYVAQADQLLKQQRKRVHVIDEQLRALRIRLAIAGRKAAAAQKGGAASAAEFGTPSQARKAAGRSVGADNGAANAAASNGNASDIQGDQRYILNSLVRPFVAGLATEEAALKRKLAAAQAEADALANLLSQLQQEKVIWDDAKRRSAAAADRAEAEAAAAAAARADLERVLAAGQHLGNVFAGKQPLAPAPPPPAVAAAVKAAAETLGNSTAAALGAMGLPGMSGLKLPAAAFAAKATDLACGLAAAKECASVEACRAEEIIFASCAALNGGRASAYALAMSAMGKGKFAIAKFLAMPPAFLQLADALKQTILGVLIPLYLGGSALHPGGSLPLLCPWIDLRLKEHCADEVITALKTAKTTNLNLVVKCLIKAQSMLGPMMVLAPECLTIFDAFSSPASKAAQGMTRSLIPAVKDVAIATAELVAAIADAAATMAAAKALYKATLCPDGFPGSFEAATRRTLQYTYYARRDSAMLHGRRLRQRQLHLANLAASGGIDVNDIMSGDAEISAGPLKTAIDAALSALGDEAAVEPTARMMRDNAHADWMAATGEIPAASFVELSSGASSAASTLTTQTTSAVSSSMMGLSSRGRSAAGSGQGEGAAHGGSTSRRAVRGNRTLASASTAEQHQLATAALKAVAASRSIASEQSPFGAALLELHRALDSVADQASEAAGRGVRAAARADAGFGGSASASASGLTHSEEHALVVSGGQGRAVSDADARAEALAEQAIAEAALAADAADAAARSSSRDAVMAAASELSLFKTCPFGNPFCPAIEFLHPPFWLLFNVLKLGWHPEGTPKWWLMGLPAPDAGGGGGALGLIERSTGSTGSVHHGGSGRVGGGGGVRGSASTSATLSRDPLVAEYARSALVSGYASGAGAAAASAGSNLAGSSGVSDSGTSGSGDITSVYLETDATAIMGRMAEAVARGKAIADAAAAAKARGLPPPLLANRTLRTLLPLSPAVLATVNHPQVLLHRAATQGSPHVLAGRQRVSCGDPSIGSKHLYDVCVAARQVEADVKQRAKQFKAAQARLTSFAHRTAAAAAAAAAAADSSASAGRTGSAAAASLMTDEQHAAELEDAWDTWMHIHAESAKTAALQREAAAKRKQQADGQQHHQPQYGSALFGAAADADALDVHSLAGEGTDGLAPLEAVDTPMKAAVMRRQLEAVLDALRPLAALKSAGIGQRFGAAVPAAANTHAGASTAAVPPSGRDLRMTDDGDAGDADVAGQDDAEDQDADAQDDEEAPGGALDEGITDAAALFADDRASQHEPLDGVAAAHAAAEHSHTTALLEIAAGRRSGAPAAAYLHARSLARIAATSGARGSQQLHAADSAAVPQGKRVRRSRLRHSSYRSAGRAQAMLEVLDTGRAHDEPVLATAAAAPAVAVAPAVAQAAGAQSAGNADAVAAAGSLRSPATDADLYPNLFFPSGAVGQAADRSGTDRTAIDAAIKRRDAAAAAAPLQPRGSTDGNGNGDGEDDEDGDDSPIIDRGKAGGSQRKRTSLPPGADEIKMKPPPPGSRPEMPPLSFGPIKLPEFPFKVGDQVNVLPPPPIWALLTLLNKGQEPPLAVGYITMLNRVSSLPWAPALTVQVKLNSGVTLPAVPIFMMRHQPKPKPWPPPNPLTAALSALAGAAGVKVNLNKPEWPTQSGWIDKSYVIPLGAAMIANPAKIIDKTKKVPGVEIVCLPYPCAPVPKPVDPLFTKIDLFPTPMSELGMLAMFLVPGDLYAQAAGYKCDCICPVPRNGKLTALDCGLLAASKFAADTLRDFTSDANSKKEDANTKFKALVVLAKDFALQAGMSTVGKRSAV